MRQTGEYADKRLKGDQARYARVQPGFRTQQEAGVGIISSIGWDDRMYGEAMPGDSDDYIQYEKRFINRK